MPGAENGTQLLSNVVAAHQAHPDITFEGFLFKQGAGDMQNRAQAESWGVKYLSIVDSTRGAAIVPSDLPFIHGTGRVDGFPDDISGIDPADRVCLVGEAVCPVKGSGGNTEVWMLLKPREA